jgi:hypothetical protein
MLLVNVDTEVPQFLSNVRLACARADHPIIIVVMIDKPDQGIACRRDRGLPESQNWECEFGKLTRGRQNTSASKRNLAGIHKCPHFLLVKAAAACMNLNPGQSSGMPCSLGIGVILSVNRIRLA